MKLLIKIQQFLFISFRSLCISRHGIVPTKPEYSPPSEELRSCLTEGKDLFLHRLLMAWWHKEPGHQLGLTDYSNFSTSRVKQISIYNTLTCLSFGLRPTKWYFFMMFIMPFEVTITWPVEHEFHCGRLTIFLLLVVEEFNKINNLSLFFPHIPFHLLLTHGGLIFYLICY